MVKKDLLFQCKGIPAFGKSLLSSLFLFLLCTHMSFGQNQISCNDLVQVSLNGNCEATITPQTIMEGGPLTADFTHTVRVSGIAPTVPYSHPVVTAPGTYSVTVTNPSGNYCWGVIKVEDKLPPAVECACPVGNTDTLCALRCTDEAAFLANTLVYERPDVEDACTTFTTVFSDQIIPSTTCGAKIIRRTWVFTDSYGNASAPCVSEYRFWPVPVDSVAAPYNNIQLTCGSDVSMSGIYSFFRAKLYTQYRAAYLLLVPGTYPTVAAAEAAANADAIREANRYAYPTINGVPLSTQVCNILAAKADTELEACGPQCNNSKKVIRLWTILDWCTGATRTITQVIKATDEEAPTIVAKDVTVSVDPWTCAGNFLLPAPEILHDNCSANVTYSVQTPLGVGITFDVLSGRYLVTGAPKGVHSFVYFAKDCCNNIGYDTVQVTILDLTAPIAVAKQNIIISLTSGGVNDGIAKLFANSVDNGSYDSCTPVYFELRREDDPVRDEDGCGNTGNFTYNADGHPFDGSSNPNAPNYDPDNGQYVTFCCADITNREGAIPFGIVKVWMRVWDDGNMSGIYGDVVNGQSDNYNETWVEVRVEDKLPPQIVCPPNITIDCDDDANDLAITGRATAFSNCLDLETEFSDRRFVNSCNVGYILRTWRIKSSPNVVCVQRIDLRNPFPAFAGSIVWPPDLTTNCTDDAASRKPTWTAGPCDQIGLSLKSDTFYFEGNACMKILNRWTVINWCTYDPNSPSPIGYYTYTQTIKVIDEVKPVLGSCADLMFAIDDDNDTDNDGNKCEKRNLTLTQTATDQGQCASDWLKWIVFVDLWGDGTNDYEFSSFLPSTDATFNDTNGNGIPDRYVSPTGQGGTVSITLPEDIAGNMSNHKVTWKVLDGCGNVTNCVQNFMVVDKKKPTPYCLNISSALMQNGQVELWAVDFNLGSFDNCTAKSNLLYTFNEESPVLARINQIHYFKGAGVIATEAEYLAGNAQKWIPATKSSGMIFNCDDLPSVDVKMSVWDEKFNYDYCVVRLNLADNQGACGSVQSTTVSGKVISHTGQNIENAVLTLSNGIPEITRAANSAANGTYTFTNAIMHYDYSISSVKNNDYLNGVSTLDLVLIQRHILGQSLLSGPYNIIAADANNDEKVTSADVLALRKLILGITNSLPNVNSWRFANAAQTFIDVTHPFPVDEKISITDLSHVMNNQNFVAVKVGDVNGNASGNATSELESRNNIVLNVKDEALEANVAQKINVTASVDNVYGMQFTLQLTDAELINIYVGGNKVNDNNIAKIDNNRYTVSWENIAGVNTQELITFEVLPLADRNISEVIALNSSITRAEIYSGNNLETAKLTLRFDGNNTDEFAVYQNEPNPFVDKTIISFTLPQAADATLKVFDVTGSVVYTKKGSFSKGINHFTLNRSDLPYTGVMIYQVESGANTATKKMIGLE